MNSLEIDAGIRNQYLLKMIARRAPTAKDKVKKTGADAYKWRSRLSKQQINAILKVTHWFNLTFYDTDPEPDYKELINWKP